MSNHPPAMPAIEPEHCLRCDYDWYPRRTPGKTYKKPKRCARCRSPYWDKPYQSKPTDARRKSRKVKSQRKHKGKQRTTR